MTTTPLTDLQKNLIRAQKDLDNELSMKIRLETSLATCETRIQTKKNKIAEYQNAIETLGGGE